MEIFSLMAQIGFALSCAFALVAVVPAFGDDRKRAHAYATARVATSDANPPHPLAPPSRSRRG